MYKKNPSYFGLNLTHGCYTDNNNERTTKQNLHKTNIKQNFTDFIPS